MEEDQLILRLEERSSNNTEVRRSQNNSVIGLDCSHNRNCIWWKRFEDLSQENERQKQQNKIVSPPFSILTVFHQECC